MDAAGPAADRLTLRDLEQFVATRRKERCGRRNNRNPKKVTVHDELRLLRHVIDTTRRWGDHNAIFPGMPSCKEWPDDARPPRKLTADEHAQLVATAAQDRPHGSLRVGAGPCPRPV